MTCRAHDRPTRTDQSPGAPARSRVPAAGAAAGGVTTASGPWALAPLVGWDVAALIHLGWTWSTIWHLDADHTARQAVREDPAGPPPTCFSSAP